MQFKKAATKKKKKSDMKGRVYIRYNQKWKIFYIRKGPKLIKFEISPGKPT